MFKASIEDLAVWSCGEEIIGSFCGGNLRAQEGRCQVEGAQETCASEDRFQEDSAAASRLLSADTVDLEQSQSSSTMTVGGKPESDCYRLL